MSNLAAVETESWIANPFGDAEDSSDEFFAKLELSQEQEAKSVEHENVVRKDDEHVAMKDNNLSEDKSLHRGKKKRDLSPGYQFPKTRYELGAVEKKADNPDTEKLVVSALAGQLAKTLNTHRNLDDETKADYVEVDRLMVLAHDMANELHSFKVHCHREDSGFSSLHLDKNQNDFMAKLRKVHDLVERAFKEDPNRCLNLLDDCNAYIDTNADGGVTFARMPWGDRLEWQSRMDSLHASVWGENESGRCLDELRLKPDTVLMSRPSRVVQTEYAGWKTHANHCDTTSPLLCYATRKGKVGWVTIHVTPPEEDVASDLVPEDKQYYHYTLAKICEPKKTKPVITNPTKNTQPTQTKPKRKRVSLAHLLSEFS